MRQRKALIKTRPTFAVVVDGECEVWYLQMLKRNERSLVVNISPQIPQKKSITQQFEIVKDLSQEYTKVFWIIDFDVIQTQSNVTKAGIKSPLQFFLEYRETIQRDYGNVIIAVNNPCIEFWFLLHFESTSKYFDSCSKAEQQLKKHLGDYQKTQKYFIKENGKDIYSQLKPHLKTALANAKILKAFDPNNTTIGLTEMPLFFNAAEFSGHFIK